MRFLSLTLATLLAAVAITACTNSSSSTTDNSATSSATSSADNSGSTGASTEPAASSGAEMGGAPPSYPGATTMAAGSSMQMGGKSEGKVLTTADSFDKVYAWYQKNMPAGSEKAHTTSPIESAVFTIGEAGTDQQSVTVTVSGSKTMITIAHVKQ